MRATAKFLILTALICMVLAGLQLNALAQAAKSGQALLTEQDIQDAEIMLLFGLVSAAGSAIWGAIQAAVSRRELSSVIWAYVGSGFLLGLFGGYAMYEWAFSKWGMSFSRVAFAGLIALGISMFAVPALQKLFTLGNERIDKIK